jgi:hypothetical protein
MSFMFRNGCRVSSSKGSQDSSAPKVTFGSRGKCGDGRRGKRYEPGCAQALDHGLRSAEAGYGWSSRTSNTRSSGFGEVLRRQL